MKYELEITVKYKGHYEELNQELLAQGFKVIDDYQLNDIYMIPSNIDINDYSNLQILGKCVLIRDVIGISKQLCYKYKEYAANGDILKQGKAKCQIDDIKEAQMFMEAIGYKVLFDIKDKNIVYSNGINELAVQLVENQDIYLEMEQENSQSHTFNGKDIEEMKATLTEYGLNIDTSNYFAKKAEDALNKVRNK